ncbi:MAG: carbohydrate ABC transporter permease, partial [Oscillospiraceae bacterium]|nr:carbohydrate ABC transporter permease [Oscillospiraceae bacterium]
MAVKQMAKTRRLRRPYSLEPIVFSCVNGLIMVIVAIVMIYPFWNTVAVSFNDAMDTLRGGITFAPRIFSTYSYEMVFRNELMITAAINSVLRTLISTVLGVFTASLIAFVISREELIGKKFITSYFLITMYISAGLIPNYFLMKSLHLLNTFWVYVLPNMFGVFSIMVIKSNIQSLPESLSEAAIVDGAGYFRVYWQIIMPCIKPVLATVALWSAVGAWNNWFDTFIYNSSADHLTTLQYEMMKLL